MKMKRVRRTAAHRWLLTLGGVAAVVGLEPARAFAADAPYVGIWVIELRNCGAPPSDPNAPLEITDDGYDQHMTHCTFKSVEQHDSDFNISAECMSSGNAKASQFTLTVSGETLTFIDETGARDFLRCQ